MEAQLSHTEKKKPGPKPKAQVDVHALESRIKTLEAVISRLAVMTGQGNMLIEYGLERWTPNKIHMNKYG